jgi:hypothetical protein
MAQLNKIVCGGGAAGNTGIPACFADPKQLVGIILAPLSFKLTASQISTTLLATLQAATHAGTGARIYPLINFEELLNDATEDPTRQTFGYGRSVMVREGHYMWQFRYLDGGLCLHKRLRSFNGKKWGAFFVDQAGLLIGRTDGNDLAPIPLAEFYAEPWRPSSGSEVSRYTVMVDFEARYLNEDIGIVDTNEDFSIQDSVKGLIDVELAVVAALNTRVVDVSVKELCANENLYDLFGSNLANVAAWVGKTAAGASLTIDSVTQVAATKAFRVTYASAGFPVSGNITLELAAPSVLRAAPVNLSGFEGKNVLTLTI